MTAHANISQQPQIKTTRVFWSNYQADKRIVVNQGGSSSGKTYAILQVLFLRIMQRPNSICTVVGSTIPNLKKGALRDMQRIFTDNPEWSHFVKDYNKTDRTYHFANGSLMEFVSYEDGMQARSGKRDYAFFNEANSISKEIYDQVAMRTGEQIFVDYNPTAAFWVHQHLIGQPDVVTFYSTFEDNPFAHPANVAHIKGYKRTDPEAWRVYGLGKTGAVRGLVFPKVNIVPELPKQIRKFSFGLDFGFNDPTACVYACEHNKELYLDEVLYDYELTGSEIAAKIKERVRQRPVICDSASPMTIAELKQNGINARPAKKGRDSILAGISLIKKFNRINITAASINLIKEQQNYKWAVKDDTQLDKPVDSFNHLWDAARYAVTATWGNFSRMPQML